jgi:hypothetical protein
MELNMLKAGHRCTDEDMDYAYTALLPEAGVENFDPSTCGGKCRYYVGLFVLLYLFVEFLCS